VRVVTVTQWWPTAWWADVVDPLAEEANHVWRAWTTEHCLNFIEIPLDAYGKSQKVTRSVYDDDLDCVLFWEALLAAGYAESDLDGSWTPYKAVGCERCKGSGYKGRVGIYQVMPITETMQDMILKHATALDIGREAQRNGVRDLRQSGLLKVKQGMTSLEEVLGCTNE